MPSWLSHPDGAHVLAIAIMVVVALAGTVLTLLTLPGTWVMVASALLLKLWQPGLFPWWVIVVAVLIAALGEAVELGASAMGAAKGGASRRGAMAAVVGSLVGAVVGSPFFFPLGSIVGGVLGAGVATLLIERGVGASEWGRAARAGAGAAAGRLAATLAKTSLAGVLAVLLSVTACFKPG